MDAYADRHEALSHHDATLVVLGVLLPTFMGSLDQTILANALPTIGRDFNDVHNLPWLITASTAAVSACAWRFSPTWRARSSARLRPT